MKKYKHIPTGKIATKNTACNPYDYSCGTHIAAWIIESGGKDWEEIREPLAILSVKNCNEEEFKIGDKTSKGEITKFELKENGEIEAILNITTPANFNINELEKK